MKIVVTGATSFIGRVVVRQLLQLSYEVIAVIRPQSKNIQALLTEVESVENEKLTIVSCNLSSLDNCLEELGDYKDVYGVIHGAWDGAGSNNRENREIQQSNIEQTLNVVKLAHRMGCEKFLFTGSQAEYGIVEGMTLETTQVSPISEYAKAKVEVERLAKELCKSFKIEYIHTRIFSMYGPGDHPWSLVQTCLQSWKNKETIQLGPCTQLWNFLYIEDGAAALIHLLFESKGGIYHVASLDTRPLKDYVEEMYQVSGGKGSYCHGQRKPNAEGVVSLHPDITKILETTTWKPKITFAEGIYETMHHMSKTIKS